jgi:serine/threonine protein kinase
MQKTHPDADLDAVLEAVNAGYERGVIATVHPEDLGAGRLPTSFEANGKTYELSQDELKQGGMSSVGVYKCGTEEVVLKRTKPGEVNEATFDAMAHEALIQLAANAASDRTTKLIDAIRLPDGSLGMVMRRAHGDFEKKVMPHLEPAVRAARITQLPRFEPTEKGGERLSDGSGGPIESELTPEREKYCKDAVRAVAELHKNGITHNDLKGENFFTVEDPKTGELRVEVADFGTAQFGKMRAAPTVDCPNWRDPEVAKTMRLAKKLKDKLETTLQTRLENRQRFFDKAKGKAREDAAKKLDEVKLEIGIARTELAALPPIDGAAADSWSLGCMLYQACTGLWPFERQDTGGIGQWIANEDEVNKFCSKDPQTRFQYLFKNTKVPEHFRAAIMGALNPDPAQRLTADQIVASIEDTSSAFAPTDIRRARAATAA